MSTTFGAAMARQTTYIGDDEPLESLHQRWMQAESVAELVRQQFERRIMGITNGAVVEGGLEQAQEGHGDIQGDAIAAEQGGEVGTQDPQGLEEEGECQ